MTEFVAEGGLRLDVFLTEETDYTRSFIKQLIDGGRVTVDGETCKCGRTLRGGELIVMDVPEPQLCAEPQDIPLDIIYEDDYIAVVNKQQGLSVHPAGGIFTGTLVNALLFHLKNLSGINGAIRPGIVHRLDKDTSGLMVIARTDEAHLSLSRQLAERSVYKLYLAVNEGVIKEDEGRIATKIGRSRGDRKKMAVTPDGRDAVSEFKVLERFKDATYTQFHILTGRTHQIRVHSQYIGHPIVGDKLYGYKKQRFSLDGQLLHAYKLEFTHPVTGERIGFTAPPPDYFERVLEILRQKEKQ